MSRRLFRKTWFKIVILIAFIIAFIILAFVTGLIIEQINYGDIL